MREREEQSKPRPVPKRLERDGETRARWARVEAPIWTERMLNHEVSLIELFGHKTQVQSVKSDH